jgi:hypothetical protein
MFNKTTGEFKISGTEMYRLRAQAQALGISYEELANTAVKAAKESEILSQIRFLDIPEETKQLVANLGEIKDGQVQVKLPGTDDFVKASELTKEQIKSLEEYQTTAQLSDRQIAENQLTVLQKIETSLSGLKNLTVGQPQFQELGKAAAESFQKSFEGVTKEFKEVAGSEKYQKGLAETTKIFTDGVTNTLDKLKEGDFKGATDAIFNMGKEALEATGAMNQLTEGVKKLGESLFGGLDKFIPKKGNDVLLGPSPNTVVSAPQGTFKLNEKDTVIAGTNLFDKGQSQIQKLEFANAAEVRVGGTIQINGIQPGTIGDMLLRDPDFQSGIKNLFSKNFKEQLGTA